MLEIENPQTKLSKTIPINGWSQKDINKTFKVYVNAGYKITFKG